MTLTILSYNIKLGGTGREEFIAAVINAAAPDVVMLQEARRPEVVRRLADATGMTTAITAPGRSVACLSRVAIASHRYVRPLFSQHAFLEVTAQECGLRIIGVHLSAVHAAWTERRRVRELRSPDEKFDVSKLPYRLRVLVWLSGGRIRWQTIAIMLGANYIDAFRKCDEVSPGYTFPTWDPHVRLDYAFVPKPFADRILSCHIVGDSPDVKRASDHFPLRIDLRC